MPKRAEQQDVETVAFFMRLPRWVEERVRAEAKLREMSPQALIKEMLVERYRPEAREARREA